MHVLYDSNIFHVNFLVSRSLVSVSLFLICLYSQFPHDDLSLLLSVCPSISHLLWISQHVSPRGPSKKLHTLHFDTNVLEHLSHLSELVINIWAHPLSLGGAGSYRETHTVNAHYAQAAKHVDVSNLLVYSSSFFFSHIDITNLLSLGFLFLLISQASPGRSRTLSCLAECISSSAIGLHSNEF